MIFGLIELQRCGTEEIDRLKLLLAQKEADLALLKAERTTHETSGEPGVVLERYNENALLKAENTALKKYDAKRGKLMSKDPEGDLVSRGK
ncbi:hypothetical protein HAX54_043271, partial [Datura stramonium]|nr:hypothetical protein [Datura stramonium]